MISTSLSNFNLVEEPRAVLPSGPEFESGIDFCQ